MTRELAIGPDFPALVIAEIGVNHDGSVARAMELLRCAKKAGADAAKLQLFRADRLMHPSGGFADYQKKNVADDSARQMLRRYELSDAAVKKIAAEADKLEIWLLATPFSPGDLKLVEELDLPAIKIASPDLVNKPLLKQAAALGRPLLLSTGAADLEEIDRTVVWMVQWEAPFALMHCVSAYPTPSAEAHLNWIGELRARYGIPVGFSDHTCEIVSGALAVAAGAKMIEKHLTYDRSASGPDHAASLDGKQFAKYVAGIRQAEVMLGGPKDGKRVLPIEQDVRRVSRQSLVAARAIAAGKKIVAKDVTVQRPGTGVPAADVDEMIGRTAKREIAAGKMFSWDMVK